MRRKLRFGEFDTGWRLVARGTRVNAPDPYATYLFAGSAMLRCYLALQATLLPKPQGAPLARRLVGWPGRIVLAILESNFDIGIRCINASST